MRNRGLGALSYVLAFFGCGIAGLSTAQEVEQAQQTPQEPQSTSSTDNRIDPERRESTITVSRRALARFVFDGDAARARDGFFRVKQPFVDIPVKPNFTGRLKERAKTFGILPSDALPEGTPVYLARYGIVGEFGSSKARDFWCAPLLDGEKAVVDHDKAVELAPYVSVVCAPVKPTPGVLGTDQHFAGNSPPFLLRPQIHLRTKCLRGGAGGCQYKSRARDIADRMIPWNVSIEPVQFAVEMRAYIYATAITDDEIKLRIDYQEGRGNLQLGAIDLPVIDHKAYFELPIGKYEITIAEDKSGIYVKTLSERDKSDPPVSIEEVFK